jgi:hypothetical protein
MIWGCVLKWLSVKPQKQLQIYLEVSRIFMIRIEKLRKNFSLAHVSSSYLFLIQRTHKKQVCRHFRITQQHTKWITVRLVNLNTRLLARSQFASRRSSDRFIWSKFSAAFFGSRVNSEVLQIFHLVLHASRVAFPVLALKFCPKCSPPDNKCAPLNVNVNSKDPA